MSTSLAASWMQFGDKITIIQCSPAKKKKRSRNSRSSSVISQDELPKFVLRFSLRDNALHIDAINITNMYQLILTEEELTDHLSNSNLNNCAWNKYCAILSSTFNDPLSNITLTKGKGGGYVVLQLRYIVTSDIVLNGTLELCLIDMYCQNEQNTHLPSKYKEKIAMEMFESALNRTVIENVNVSNVSVSNVNGNSNSSVEAKDDELKSEGLKSENTQLQRKVMELREENNRLKTMTQNTNMGIGGMSLTQNATMAMSVMVGSVNSVNPRKRKLRDTSKSFMNPRREKRKKTRLNFSGAKKK